MLSKSITTSTNETKQSLEGWAFAQLNACPFCCYNGNGVSKFEDKVEMSDKKEGWKDFTMIDNFGFALC
ncbi:hypothetical protein VNO77_17246 [Canavalia gladiata]|uniref:Uncharacterized protein n=1 Tax=Canavalia gladiata TaxID=3824 RepID=A0AAN9LII5_CANGL